MNTFVESSYMQINGPPPPSVFDSSSSKWNYSTMYICMAAVLYLLFSFLGIIDINVIQGKASYHRDDMHITNVQTHVRS